MRERLRVDAPLADKAAAKQVAHTLADRIKALGMTQLTWERRGFRTGPGEHGKAHYAKGTKVCRKGCQEKRSTQQPTILRVEYVLTY